MYAVVRNYLPRYSSEYNGTHLSTDCLQRCTYSGNHGIQSCTPWIEIIYHDIQSECNGTHLSTVVSRDVMISLWSLRYPWIEIIFHWLPIVSRDVMMNYYIPWKSLTGACHDVRRGLKIIFFHCLPFVSRDVHILVIMAYNHVRRGSKLSTTISKVNTIGRHLSTDCLQRCTYSGNHGCHDVRRGLKIIYHDIQSEYNGTHLSTVVSRMW